MLNNTIETLSNCILFRGMDRVEISSIMEGIDYSIKSYDSDDIIAIEGDICTSLSIILSGEIEIHKPFSSGKVVTISHFTAGNIFAESLVFSDMKEYPATVVSSTDSTVMSVPKNQLIEILSRNPKVLENFAGVLSRRIHMLNDRITNLSYDTTRKKIVNILLLEYGRQKSPYLLLPYSRKKMAELLNIPRPSLSRELIRMRDDQLIDFYKNRIKILDLKSLEKELH